MNHPTYLNIEDLKTRYSIRHHSTALKLAHEIGCIKAGGKWLVNLADVERWEQSSIHNPYVKSSGDESVEGTP